MEWITNNIHWIFSGIGVAVLGFVLNVMFKRKENSQVIKNHGDNSTNIQIQGVSNKILRHKDE